MEALGAILHPDFIEYYPQSGERIRGVGNLRATIENYPGGLGEPLDRPTYHGPDEQWEITPNFTVVRVTEAGNAGTGVVRVRYPDGSDWWMIVLFELRDGLLHRQTTFFAQPFAAPAWRSQWVERD